MARLYNSTQQNTPTLIQYVGAATPIEDRMVVEYEEDLHNPNTWGEIMYGFMWGLRIFKGMTVLVASDTDDKNGLYWLKTMPKSEDYYKIGAWGTEQCMSIDGWEKIGSGTQVEVDDETIKFDPNQTPGDSDDNQIWVNQVNGGSWDQA